MNNNKSNQELETILELKGISELSEKLNKYIEKVKKETGRSVKIKGVQDVGLNGMSSVVELDCKCICVKVIEEEYYDLNDLKKEKINQEEIEWMIAHEVTHGFLVYKEKYFNYCFPIHNELVVKSTKLLFTMIEDIVVSKVMHENNFPKLPKSHYTTIEHNFGKAIKIMEEGEDPYRNYDQYPQIFKNRFMVFTFIQAWGYLEYFKICEINKKTLRKFLEIFQKKNPRQHEEAEKIITIIKENNIFTTGDFNKTIKKCLDLWKLTDLVRLYTC